MFLAKVYVQFENALKPVNLALKKLQRDYSKFAEDWFIKWEKLIEMKEKEDEIRDTEIEFKIEKVTISAQDQSQVEEKIFTTKDISKVVELYWDKFELSLK